MTDIKRWIAQTENGPVEVVEAKEFDDFKTNQNRPVFGGVRLLAKSLPIVNSKNETMICKRA
jgi:hypothetical protein